MTNINIVKKFSDSEAVTFGTHNGTFHADEVMSTAVMDVAINCLSDGIELVRTRDPEILSKAFTVYDVGGEYNDREFRFDHHQKETPLRSDGSPYSSAGLIWKHFGEQFLTLHPVTKGLSQDQKQMVWRDVDEKIMRKIDLADNGKGEMGADVISLQHIISSFNPSWDEDIDEDLAFLKAVEVARSFIDRSLIRLASKSKVKDLVEGADRLFDKKVLVLEKFIPWQDIVMEDERYDDLLFVIFPDKSGQWRVQCIPPSKDKPFEQRQPLKKEWAGLRGDELSNIAGVPGCVFCHPGRFIAGTQSLLDAVRLVEQIVPLTEEQFFSAYGENCCAGCDLADSEDYHLGMGGCDPVNASCYGDESCPRFKDSKRVFGGVKCDIY